MSEVGLGRKYLFWPTHGILLYHIVRKWKMKEKYASIFIKANQVKKLMTINSIVSSVLLGVRADAITGNYQWQKIWFIKNNHIIIVDNTRYLSQRFSSLGQAKSLSALPKA